MPSTSARCWLQLTPIQKSTNFALEIQKRWCRPEAATLGFKPAPIQTTTHYIHLYFQSMVWRRYQIILLSSFHTCVPKEEPIWARNIVLFLNVIKKNRAFSSVESPWEEEITYNYLERDVHVFCTLTATKLLW